MRGLPTLATRRCDVQYPTGMEEDMILTIAKDVLHGLQYLHSHDFAHRDLKVYASTSYCRLSAALHSGIDSNTKAL